MTLLRSRPTVLAALLMALLIWLPRGFALDQFVTADEHAWLARSGNFYRALSRGDFAATFQRHHPGVTTTWAGLAGYLVTYPRYAQEAPAYYGYITEEVEGFLRANGYDPVRVLAAGRAFVVLVITASLTLAFVLAQRLFGLWPALMGFSLIALAPFHIAHSRLLHLDGLMSTFMFVAVMAYLASLKQRSVAYLALAGITAGLAWLTRSPALYLMPYMGLIGLLAWALNRHSDVERIPFWLQMGLWLLWALIGAITFFLLWPAMWVSPISSLREVLGAATEYASEGHLKPIFFNGEIYTGDPGFWFYPITWLWRTTPAVILGLALALVTYVRKLAPFDERVVRWMVLALLVYALGFVLFMNLGAKKFDRYLLPVYPPLALLAGLGIASAAAWGTRAVRASVARWVMPLSLGAIILLQGMVTLPTFPYYLSYYNPLLGGSARAPRVMAIGWGEGGDRAADYLNTRPDSANSVVASGYTNGPFSYYYNGETVPLYFRHMADYAVVYAQDWQRQLPSQRAIAYYAEHEPLQVIAMDGLDYAHIYDLNTLPEPDFVTNWAFGTEGKSVLRLASYQLPAATIQPGETIQAILYLVNQAPIDVNLNVLVRLVGADGSEIARSDGWPWGSATSGWQQGEVWPDGHTLTIPTDAEPGWYRLDVSFYDPATQAILQAVQVNSGETIGEALSLDYLRIGRNERASDFARRQGFEQPYSFDNALELQHVDWRQQGDEGIQLESATLQAGEVLTATLSWETLQPMDTDYTAFVHIVGPDGVPLVQVDRQPLHGFMPTSTWLPGQQISDDFVVALPEQAPPAQYAIYTGMYDLATMTRLPVSQNSEPIGDSVPVGMLTIE